MNIQRAIDKTHELEKIYLDDHGWVFTIIRHVLKALDEEDNVGVNIKNNDEHDWVDWIHGPRCVNCSIYMRDLVGSISKCAEKKCKCLYISDCHAIEMIKSPSGKEWSIGGSETQDRFKFCPWCGGKI